MIQLHLELANGRATSSDHATVEAAILHFRALKRNGLQITAAHYSIDGDGMHFIAVAA